VCYADPQIEGSHCRTFSCSAPPKRDFRLFYRTNKRHVPRIIYEKSKDHPGKVAVAATFVPKFEKEQPIVIDLDLGFTTQASTPEKNKSSGAKVAVDKKDEIHFNTLRSVVEYRTGMTVEELRGLDKIDREQIL
jgi:hypothetical protein